MAIKIKTQTDYLFTETNIDLPCDLNELDALMRMIKATGKIVISYAGGGLYGINVEQRTKVREAVADKVREMVGVPTKEINGHD